MSDPTQAVITATFCTALAVFVVTAILRKFLGSGASATPPPLPEMVPASVSIIGFDNAGSPYDPPAQVDLSLIPPVKRGVDVSFYRSWDLLGIALVFAVYFLLVVSSLQDSGKSESTLNPFTLVASIIFQYFTAAVVMAMVIIRVRPIRWLGLRWPQWPWVFLIAPCTVFGMWILFSALQASGYMDWIESLGVETVQDTVKLLKDSKDPATLALMSFAAVIAAPMCEEIVFRGYLYSASKRFLGSWAAMIFSGLIFGAAHGSLAALLPLAIFGWVLALIYEKTGSLWAPMGVHFCFNGATVLIQLAIRFSNLHPSP